MGSFNFKGKIGGAIFAASLVLGIGIMSSTTAQAQRRNDGQWQRRDRSRQERIYRNDRRRNDDRYRRNDGYGNNGRNRGYGNNGGYNNAYQIAMNQGYQAGVNTGARDAQRGQSYSPQRSHYYKEASTQAFRDGFVQGYDAGYRQYGGHNNNDVYRRSNTGNGIGSILGSIFGRP